MKRLLHNWVSLSLISLFIISMCLTACDFNIHLSQASQTASGTLTPDATQIQLSKTPTPILTATATQVPPGSPQNPISIAFVSDYNNSTVTSAATAIATKLTQKTGYTFSASYYANYVDLYIAIKNQKVGLAWLPPFTYMLAHQNGWMDAALVTDHYGIYSYGTMFLAHKDSGFTPYFDTDTNKNLTDAKTALAQLRGKRPCWVEPTSASGYIVPAGILAQADIPFQPAVITQTFDTVLRALYVQQICDFGATYAISGDPRTASTVQSAMPDIMDKVIILYQSDAVIPNLNLSFGTNVTKGQRGLITDTLTNWVKTDEGKTALTNANQYAIEDFKPIDDSYYEPLRSLLKSSYVDLSTLIGR